VDPLVAYVGAEAEEDQEGGAEEDQKGREAEEEEEGGLASPFFFLFVPRIASLSGIQGASAPWICRMDPVLAALCVSQWRHYGPKAQRQEILALLRHQHQRCMTKVGVYEGCTKLSFPPEF
jgi:hypothetical protein